MSLVRLLRWHYFSIQSSLHSPVNADGSIDRWTNSDIICWNLNGHRQRPSPDRVFFDYDVRDSSSTYILYFKSSVIIQSWHRILMNLNPKKKLNNPMILGHTKECPKISIMEFVGYADQVDHPKIDYKAVVLRELQWFAGNN